NPADLYIRSEQCTEVRELLPRGNCSALKFFLCQSIGQLHCAKHLHDSGVPERWDHMLCIRIVGISLGNALGFTCSDLLPERIRNPGIEEIMDILSGQPIMITRLTIDRQIVDS